MYKHIIWDFDGTLFDTYPVMASVFQKKLIELNIDETVDEVMSYMKVSMTYAIDHYKEKYNIDDEFINDYIIKSEEEEFKYCKPFDGIYYICKIIYNHGFKNYLYTHRDISSIDFLKKFDLYKYFSDFITYEDRFKRKPDPEALNFLIKKHNIDLKEALMIGDRDIDVLSAKNACIDSCFFSDKTQRSTLSNYNIDKFHDLLPIIGIPL
ncbi:MAG: HAD-IA family hydrolase [Oscillospiraceae bacterium]|nr:HAD-IA family hydrolase [Oscillospiraceae bacterium]